MAVLLAPADLDHGDRGTVPLGEVVLADHSRVVVPGVPLLDQVAIRAQAVRVALGPAQCNQEVGKCRVLDPLSLSLAGRAGEGLLLTGVSQPVGRGED